MWGYEEIWDRL